MNQPPERLVWAQRLSALRCAPKVSLRRGSWIRSSDAGLDDDES